MKFFGEENIFRDLQLEGSRYWFTLQKASWPILNPPLRQLCFCSWFKESTCSCLIFCQPNLSPDILSKHEAQFTCFPTTRGGSYVCGQYKKPPSIINNYQDPVRGVTNHPTEATSLLKSSRETLFANKLVIELLIVLNNQAEVQRIFAIVKYMNILLSVGPLKLFRNTKFQLQVGAHSTYDICTKEIQNRN